MNNQSWQTRSLFLISLFSCTFLMAACKVTGGGTSDGASLEDAFSSGGGAGSSSSSTTCASTSKVVEQAVQSGSNDDLTGGTTLDASAQGFVVATAAKLASFEFQAVVDTGSGSTVVALLQTSAQTDSPTAGTTIASVTASLASTGTWQVVNFPTHPSLTAGTHYLITVAPASGVEVEFGGAASGNHYASGDFFVHSSGSWIAGTNHDLQFRVNVCN